MFFKRVVSFCLAYKLLIIKGVGLKKEKLAQCGNVVFLALEVLFGTIYSADKLSDNKT